MASLQPPVRTALSCTFCRQKKLRCDRLQPCSSCVKRGLDCVYTGSASAASRRNPPSSARHLSQRIRQLEELVTVLQKGGGSGHSGSPLHTAQERQFDDADGQDAITNSLGSMRVDPTGMSYVSGAHWAALQDSIAEIKECVDSESPFTTPAAESGQQESALLLGLSPPGGMEEILAHIPARPIVDRLVSRFFSSMEPGVLIIHAPTFQQEYDHFWTDPQSISPTWLSILFSIMNLAIHLHQRTEGPITPDPIDNNNNNITTPETQCETFRLQAAYCLLAAKYTTPTKYTLEALSLYTQTEYFRSKDAQHEVWLLMGMTIRLAMRAGLHRDGAGYSPELSCFEAEMRRRLWSLMAQLDALFSFQIGLPRMIASGVADTRPPHNLLDEDFGPASTSLPPPRAETEFTPVLYLIAKSRLAEVFGRIADHVASTGPTAPTQVVQLDQQLNAAYAGTPAVLKFREVGASVTELPHLVMLRYNLEILYQKSRCILHRRGLGEGRSDPRGAASRAVCLDAAMRLLRHQATIDAQVQPGGVLSRCRWFVTSLTTHDFIFAAMVVCFELHLRRRDGGGDTHVYNPGTEALLLALRTSQRILTRYQGESAEARQAWLAISVMVRKVDGSAEDAVAGGDGGVGCAVRSGGSDTVKEPDQDNEIPGCPVDQFRDMSALGMPSSIVPSLEEFDFTQLPSDLVNMWDFSGDTHWVFGNNN
ncbi:Zn(II)2Cys6 transcription factor [Aspergillus brunneoviolaceus CBS 621.78]|uniref:Zn(II)2Cys6 transcription factor n=1 Tax=Aspergillus brunneoviolaceus CBS 621.78 TaxID=1450534 RepID=A0ACD1FS63_9EURO|nr:Zn(II)2Cys6 transcription factor [Aspergillus brunneoviolaceus CBS 621.78]RAH39831.1 Zn(II)2Cys6 transcription factor [Aspergillus brunneoviolaceus CBS 621.78]